MLRQSFEVVSKFLKLRVGHSRLRRRRRRGSDLGGGRRRRHPPSRSGVYRGGAAFAFIPLLIRWGWRRTQAREPHECESRAQRSYAINRASGATAEGASERGIDTWDTYGLEFSLRTMYVRCRNRPLEYAAKKLHFLPPARCIYRVHERSSEFTSGSCDNKL